MPVAQARGGSINYGPSESRSGGSRPGPGPQDPAGGGALPKVPGAAGGATPSLTRPCQRRRSVAAPLARASPTGPGEVTRTNAAAGQPPRHWQTAHWESPVGQLPLGAPLLPARWRVHSVETGLGSLAPGAAA